MRRALQKFDFLALDAKNVIIIHTQLQPFLKVAEKKVSFPQSHGQVGTKVAVCVCVCLCGVMVNVDLCVCV